MKLGIFTSQICSDGKKNVQKRSVRAKLFLILTLLYVFDDLVTVAVVGSQMVFNIIVRKENVWKHPLSRGLL